MASRRGLRYILDGGLYDDMRILRGMTRMILETLAILTEKGKTMTDELGQSIGNLQQAEAATESDTQAAEALIASLQAKLSTLQAGQPVSQTQIDEINAVTASLKALHTSAAAALAGAGGTAPAAPAPSTTDTGGTGPAPAQGS